MDAPLSGSESAESQLASGSARHQQSSNRSKQPKEWFRRQLRVKLVVVLLILVVLIAGGLLSWHRQQQLSGASTVNKNEYQAVFLTNGQVYFGKLQTVNQSYLTLVKIFYLQVQQSVQPAASSSTSATSSTAVNSSSTSNNGSVQLVKLGNELHGPVDEMTIVRTQVLFWENLKPGGKVTQAIDQYYKSNP